MRKNAIFAIIGFLIGAAAIAGGDENEDLRDELRALQRQAARVELRDWDTEGIPAADDRGNQLGVFPIADIAFPRPWFIPALGRLVFEGSEQPLFGGVAEGGVLPFGSGEEILELLRTSISPESWEEGEIKLAGNNTLLTLTAPNTNGLVREELETRLRPRAHRGISLDFEVLEIDAKTARRLRSLERGVLNNAQRTALTEAVKAGSARRVMALRGAGTLGTQFTVSHGQEIAFLSDAEVEVAQTASTADPVVQIGQVGGHLAVHAVADERGRTLRLVLDLKLVEIEEVRRHETRAAGVLDQPKFKTQAAKVSLAVPAGAWVVASAGNGSPGVHRVFLIRARVLDRATNITALRSGNRKGVR